MASDDQAISPVLHLVSDTHLAKKKLEATLSNSAFFGQLDGAEVQTLTSFLPVFRVDEGDGVYVEGERRAGYMCIVVEGSLDIVKDTEKGSSRRIAIAKIGDTIGEMSLIDGFPHSATAVARELVLLAVLTGEKLDYICKEYPVLGAKLLRKIAEVLSLRLREANMELAHYMS
jgi:CRP/FNR family cyclic AMP-dependent transcriptional regulator